MTYNYRPNGVCARGISFDIEDGKVTGIGLLRKTN